MSVEISEVSLLEELAGIYSDTYKDAYGVRPRRDVRHWTVADFEREIDELSKIAAQEAEWERQAEAEAAVKLEATIDSLIAKGAKDRATAIRWLAEANGVDSESRYDMDHLCYRLGVAYGYFTK